jgi:hypothetical protein
MLTRHPDAELFLTRTVSLGVEDVGLSDAPRCVVVRVVPDLSDSERDAICLLAHSHWPEERIVIAPRVATRQTGTFPKISREHDEALADAEDRTSEAG